MKSLLIPTALAAILATPLMAAGSPGSGFLTNWDLDENGVVTLAEVTEKRGDILYTFDDDGDGVITAAEYVAFDEARAADQANEGYRYGGQGNASVGMTLVFNDTDGDGAVSREEFIGKSGAWFAILDRNRDGEVTAEDFGRR